jgi:hypothetical protein
VLLGSCSGSIYRQRPLRGAEPVAITVDARQRVLLSQPDRKIDGTSDPQFRRYCAEPSPDVFTVLGVAASGSGNFATGADKSVNAALQAAFSSTETGTTIARTQTLNMLREMMFRTCERYLSGAISPDEFPIIAARDQRIMVSILAIEQLTGAVTPRPVGLSATGSASTGLNPTEMVKLLAAAQGDIKTADDDVAAKTKKVTEADAPSGTCATLRKKKADGTPALTADETNKLNTCEAADKALSESKAKRDVAQANYDDLVAASKKGIGVSSAATGGKVDFGQGEDHKEAVASVAAAVGTIVRNTFDQDETQLFCIRVLNPQLPSFGNPELRQKCLNYLVARVTIDQASLARRYGMNPADFNVQFGKGVDLAQQTQNRAQRLYICGNDPGRSSAFNDAVSKAAIFGADAPQFLSAIKAGPNAVEEYLRRSGEEAEDQIASAMAPLCGAGD